MTDRERIKKAIEVINLLMADLNKNNTNTFFDHKNTLWHIFYENKELHKAFRDTIPITTLGRFERWLHQFLSDSGLSHADIKKIIDSLIEARRVLIENCKINNCRIFYSWQSDLPNNTNRSFIQTSIQDALDELNSQNNWGLYIDSDTRGTCGSPDVVNTILAKIDDANVFIADVSSIANIEDKSIPNPNVMFELGYAIRAMGADKILMVYNENTGDISDLPFDLGLKRQIIYCSKKEDEVKKDERNKLKEKLKIAIKAIVES